MSKFEVQIPINKSSAKTITDRMSDLIERLKTERSVYDAELCDEAADEIETLYKAYIHLRDQQDKSDQEIINL
jgi:hypothetical protein